MHIRNRFFIALVMLIIGSFYGELPLLRGQSRSPNIIILLADDMGWGDVGFHENPIIETPVLDSLAQESIELCNFYVSPLCAPTRASLLTGRDHLRTGTISVSKGLENMDSDELTLAEICKENGYATACFGKWHNGEYYPQNARGQGFDHFFGFSAGHLSNYFNSPLLFNDQWVDTEGYITDVLTDQALAFIQNQRDQPFLCYLAYNVPHSPFQAPEPLFQKYRQKGQDNQAACISAMIENMDENIGRIMKALNDLGLENESIIVFLSDNGPNGQRYNGGLRGIKGEVYEGGVKVPFLIAYPGTLASGTVLRQPFAHIDLLPTLVDLAHLRLGQPKAWDGINFAPYLLDEEKTSPRRAIYSHVAFLDTVLYPSPLAIHYQNYHFVMRDAHNPELYDLEKDPQEKYNLARPENKLLTFFQSKARRWFADQRKGLSFIRPIPIQAHQVELQAHHAKFQGRVSFKEGHGWAHDWLCNWTSEDDLIYWDIALEEAQHLEFSLKYTCPDRDTGSSILLSGANQEIRSLLDQSYSPQMVPSPDRVERQEVYEQTWAIKKLGSLRLPPGNHQIRLRAENIPGRQVAEIKSLILKVIEE